MMVIDGTRVLEVMCGGLFDEVVVALPSEDVGMRLWSCGEASRAG